MDGDRASAHRSLGLAGMLAVMLAVSTACELPSDLGRAGTASLAAPTSRAAVPSSATPLVGEFATIVETPPRSGSATPRIARLDQRKEDSAPIGSSSERRPRADAVIEPARDDDANSGESTRPRNPAPDGVEGSAEPSTRIGATLEPERRDTWRDLDDIIGEESLVVDANAIERTAPGSAAPEIATPVPARTRPAESSTSAIDQTATPFAAFTDAIERDNELENDPEARVALWRSFLEGRPEGAQSRRARSLLESAEREVERRTREDADDLRDALERWNGDFSYDERLVAGASIVKRWPEHAAVPAIRAVLAESSFDRRFIELGFRPVGKNTHGFREYADARSGMVFVLVPAGTFEMGATMDDHAVVLDSVAPAEREDVRRYLVSELPRHVVRVSEFLIAKHEVTQANWERVLGRRANPSRFRSTKDLPVDSVSWEACLEYFQTLNGPAKSKTPETPGFWFPTEAQWERACRADTPTAIYSGPMTIRGDRDSPELDAIAWYAGNSGIEGDYIDPWDSSGWTEKQYPHSLAGTHEVAQKKPNDFGIYDMIGNVWEWCADVYDAEYYSSPAATKRDPRCDEGSEYRVLRGGSCNRVAWHCRSSFRGWDVPSTRSAAYGFRPAFYPLPPE
jgi:formylglycine-generating enzyme required for sulfatase activity